MTALARDAVRAFTIGAAAALGAGVVAVAAVAASDARNGRPWWPR